MRILELVFIFTCFLGSTGVVAAHPAKKLFGVQVASAALEPAPVGSYAKGCLAGGQPLAQNGPNYQVMRLSRNRYWGHPVLINYIEKIATAAHEEGWRGLMFGDMSQPRGGPMLTGHTSHQIGLDADIWLKPMPAKIMGEYERENVSAVSMLNEALTEINTNQWTQIHGELIRQAALPSEVARIFVHPVIKRELCRTAVNDRSWLRKIRSWWGHHYHFHVRLACPNGARECIDQAAPPPGDGCGAELKSWLNKAKKPTKPSLPIKKKRDLMIADLPASCRAVLATP